MNTILDLTTKEGISEAARRLAEHLHQGYADSLGREWTDHNFELLRSFSEEHLGVKPADGCFHRKRNGHPEDKAEFLWDFIALSRDRGILLAAESEQNTFGEGNEIALKHDFEKLLYVFAPLRLLICKSKNEKHRESLVKQLIAYAHGCCRSFNPVRHSSYTSRCGSWIQVKLTSPIHFGGIARVVLNPF